MDSNSTQIGYGGQPRPQVGVPTHAHGQPTILAFTGMDLGLLVGGAVLLLIAGLMLRRLVGAGD